MELYVSRQDCANDLAQWISFFEAELGTNKLIHIKDIHNMGKVMVPRSAPSWAYWKLDLMPQFYSTLNHKGAFLERSCRLVPLLRNGYSMTVAWFYADVDLAKVFTEIRRSTAFLDLLKRMVNDGDFVESVVAFLNHGNVIRP